MKTGRIYKIFNRDNLELLIKKVVRKKRMNKEAYYYKEEEMEMYSEKVSKNWKTRWKKPSDKMIKILMSSCNIKEFNKRRNESNVWEKKFEERRNKF
jgi:hypothetical protein